MEYGFAGEVFWWDLEILHWIPPSPPLEKGGIDRFQHKHRMSKLKDPLDI
jgi:hypothetical protein